MINFDNIHFLDKHLDYLSKKISKENIFIVGGCVRDMLLGVESNPADIDITTDQDPNTIFSKINKENISIFKTEKFGTITIIPHNLEIKNKIKTIQNKGKKLQYEITPLRLEGEYLDFRHPQDIKRTNDLIKDSNRRDFTINCIYYTKHNIEFKSDNLEIINNYIEINCILDKQGYIYLGNQNILIIQSHDIINEIYPNAHININNLKKYIKNSYIYGDKKSNNKSIGIIIDPHKGINDLIEKKLKGVGNPDKRFGEDALRIIRAVRLVNIINQKISKKDSLESDYFDFDKNTWNSMKQNYYLVQYIAKERIKEEITKAFKASNPFGFIAVIDDLNLLKFLFPSLYQTKGVEQPIRYHPFDVYTHTMLCLNSVQSLNKNYLVKFGILYHDVGKPDQYYYYSTATTLEERKKVHGSILHHPILGEELVKQDFRTLGFSNKEIDEISFYVKYHMLPGELLKANPENLPKKIRKLIYEHGYDKMMNLIDVCLADRLGHYNPLQPPAIHAVKELKVLIKKLYKETGDFKLKDLKINGNDLVKKFNLNPGPKIGELLTKSFEWVIEDIKNRNNKKDIFSFLKNHI